MPGTSHPAPGDSTGQADLRGCGGARRPQADRYRKVTPALHPPPPPTSAAGLCPPRAVPGGACVTLASRPQFPGWLWTEEAAGPSPDRSTLLLPKLLHSFLGVCPTRWCVSTLWSTLGLGGQTTHTHWQCEGAALGQRWEPGGPDPGESLGGLRPNSRPQSLGPSWVDAVCSERLTREAAGLLHGPVPVPGATSRTTLTCSAQKVGPLHPSLPVPGAPRGLSAAESALTNRQAGEFYVKWFLPQVRERGRGTPLAEAAGAGTEGTRSARHVTHRPPPTREDRTAWACRSRGLGTWGLRRHASRRPWVGTLSFSRSANGG